MREQLNERRLLTGERADSSADNIQKRARKRVQNSALY